MTTQITFKTYLGNYIYVHSEASEDVVVSAVKDWYYAENFGHREPYELATPTGQTNAEYAIRSLIGNKSWVYIGDSQIYDAQPNDYKLVKLRKPRGEKKNV